MLSPGIRRRMLMQPPSGLHLVRFAGWSLTRDFAPSLSMKVVQTGLLAYK
jgi:hypothetical protein